MTNHNTIGKLLRGRCGRRCTCGGRTPKKVLNTIINNKGENNGNK